jgi:hypothetical protein
LDKGQTFFGKKYLFIIIHNMIGMVLKKIFLNEVSATNVSHHLANPRTFFVSIRATVAIKGFGFVASEHKSQSLIGDNFIC